ncbi:MAG: plastocyanin/azurin family copper-binding protein [Luteimonas sp.]|nr:plastocyanin/azurin family copper-binding protein [Luteimonas sp.]
MRAAGKRAAPKWRRRPRPPWAAAGASAGIANSYLPAGDARVLAYTRVIGGGESDTITFSTAKLKKGEDYTFFCSFPGHWAIMRGKFFFG